MLGKKLSMLTKTELEELKDELNLSEAENEIFSCLSKGKSNVQTSIICHCSLATVGNRISDIKKKIAKIEGRCKTYE